MGWEWGSLDTCPAWLIKNGCWGIVGKAATCRAGILYRHQLKSQLLHFQNSLLMPLGKQQEKIPGLGPLHPHGGPGSWLQSSLALAVVARAKESKPMDGRSPCLSFCNPAFQNEFFF